MTVFLKWTQKWSVGINEIDNQHKFFIGLVNQAHDLVKSKKGTELKMILANLTEFTRIHFTTEENYFQRYNYPYAKEHMIEHGKLTLKVLKFNERMEKYGVKIVPDLLDFLKDWFNNHLKQHDFKYARYFKENHLL
jgi:hemerythrin